VRFEGAGCRKGFYIKSFFLASIEGIVLAVLIPNIACFYT
jgi:hypothetical protein